MDCHDIVGAENYFTPVLSNDDRLGHAILGHALRHAILGNFSTDQMVIKLTKI